jgi:hypothetical protein
MVRQRKPFIDKKRATTYSLIYRPTEDSDALPERMLVESGGTLEQQQPEAGTSSSGGGQRRLPPGHPLAWLQEEEQGKEELSDARRKELIELGFPDDGYDYLKHMRLGGHAAAVALGTAAIPAAAPTAAVAAAAAPAAAGAAGVFVRAPLPLAPEEDVRLLDSTRLAVLQGQVEDEDAAKLAGGVTAFTRERREVRGAGVAGVYMLAHEHMCVRVFFLILFEGSGWAFALFDVIGGEGKRFLFVCAHSAVCIDVMRYLMCACSMFLPSLHAYSNPKLTC